MRRLVNRLAVATMVFCFYVLYTGALTGLTVLTGVLVAVVGALLIDRALVRRELSLRDAARLVRLIEYLAYFVFVELREHVALARLVLSPKIRVSPEIVSFPVSLSSDYALAMLANTITNTPGTFTLHVDKERGVFYVHWLLPKTREPEATKMLIVGRFEELARAVFE